MRRLTTWHLAGMTAGAATATVAAVLWAASPAHAGACDDPTATWVGNSISSPEDFGHPENWDRVDNTSSAPKEGDRLCIPAAPGTPTVRLYGSFDVESIETSEALEINGSLTVTTLEADHVNVNGTLAPGTATVGFLYVGGTISGGTTIVNGAGQDLSLTSMTLTDGAVVDVQNALRQIDNNQYVQLNDASRLILPGSTTLDEQWTVSTGTYADPGWIEVPSGRSLTYTASDSGSAVTWYGGVLNKGTVTVTNGDLRVYSGTPAASTGVWSSTGTGVLRLGGHASQVTQSLGDGSSLSEVTLAGHVRATGTVTSGATIVDNMTRGGPGLVRLTGTTTWKSGALDGAAGESGVTEVPAGSTLQAQTNATVSLASDQRLEIKGSAVTADNLYLDLAEDSRMVVTGSWTANGNVNTAYRQSSARIVVPDGGTIALDAEADRSAYLYPPILNQGTVSSVGGSLALYRPAGQQSGDFVANGDGAVRLVNGEGPWDLADGVLLDGVRVEGDLVVDAGTVEARGAELANGTHRGSGLLALTQGAQLAGGTFGGRVSVPAGQTAALPTNGYVTWTAGSSLDVAGTLSLGDGAQLNPTGAVSIDVSGVLRLGDESYVNGWDGDGVLRVAEGGTLRSFGDVSTSPARVFMPLVNHGTVESGANPLRLLTASSAVDRSTGDFAGGGAALVLAGEPGSLGITTGATLNDVRVEGVVTVDGAVTATDLHLDSGEVAGSGTLTLVGSPAWTGGSMGGTGTTVLAAGATGGLPGAGEGGTVRNGRTLVAQGTRALAGDLYTEAGGAVDVQGTVDLLDDASMSGSGLVLVEGAITKTTGAGTSHLSDVDNEGLIRVTSGRLSVDSLNGGGWWTGALTGGQWQAAGTGVLDTMGVGTLAADITVDGPGATVDGLDDLSQIAAAGTLRLRNGADLDVPFSDLRQEGRVLLSPTSVLHVGGSFLLTRTGQLTSSLSGAGHGSVVVDGGVNVTGGLSLDRDPAYVPAVGTRLPIVSGMGASGEFTRVDGLAIDATRHFEPSYDATSAGVLVVSGPAPSNTLRVSNLQTSTSSPTTMSLSWDAPADADQVQVVMRRGTSPATSPDEGSTVYAGTGSFARVSGIEPATSYSFSVFTWRDGISGKPVTLVRHGTDLRARAVTGHRLRVAVRDVATGRLRHGAVVQVWRRDRPGDRFALVRRVTADDGVVSFRVNGTPDALRLTTRSQGVHLAGREVVRPRW